VLKGRVTAAFRSSMEIDVTVHTEDPLTGARKLCTSALMTFVALDARGKSVAVPPLQPETDDERRLEREAHARREARLARKQQRLS
jgi:acyl-CoA hydrolase